MPHIKDINTSEVGSVEAINKIINGEYKDYCMTHKEIVGYVMADFPSISRSAISNSLYRANFPKVTFNGRIYFGNKEVLKRFENKIKKEKKDATR